MALFVDGKDFFAPVIKTIPDPDGSPVTFRCNFLGQNCTQFNSSSSSPTASSTFYLPVPGVYLKGNVTINVVNTTYISLAFASGIVINVCWRAPGVLLLTQQVPRSLMGNVSGMLGDFNGNSSDDLRVYNGSTIPSNSSLSVIHHSYGLSCKLCKLLHQVVGTLRKGIQNTPTTLLVKYLILECVCKKTLKHTISPLPNQ